MLDILKTILSALSGDGGSKGLSKLEKELARKFDALEEQARKDNAFRWTVLLAVCALLGLGGWLGHRQMKHEVRTMIAERLDKEFSSDALKQTIEASAQDYTKSHLKDYVDGRLAAQTRVAKLESMARLDSRQAYQQLALLAEDPQFRDDAHFSLTLVRQRYSALTYPFEAQTALEAREGSALQLKLDPSKSADAQVDALRPRLMQLAQESQKNYLVPDFIRFLKESDSLGASVGVCRILAHNYGAQAGDFEFEKWIQYLETLDKNAVKITGAAK